MAETGGADTKKTDEVPISEQSLDRHLSALDGALANIKRLTLEMTKRTIVNAQEEAKNPGLPKFQYTVDDVPEGQVGLDWLIANREEVFPWVNNQIMFDNAGSPPGSRFYFDAVKQYQDRRMLGYGEMGNIGNRIKEARQETAKLLHCDSDEIAFIQSTSHGINIVAQGIEGLNWKSGDEIIVGRVDKEYPSNYAPWRQLKERLARRGIEVTIKEIGDENGFISPEDVSTQVSDRTRFVTLSSIGWKSGQRINLEEIGKIIKSKGALFHVDAIQSLGAYDIDVKKCNIDFLSASAHKWMLADKGNGIFYCRKEIIKNLSKHAPLGAESFSDWKDSNSPLKENAEVFETGAISHQGVHGLSQALRLINKVGIKNIEKRVLELSDYLKGGENHKKLEAKGYTIFGTEKDEEKSGMVFITRPEWEKAKDKSTVEKQIEEMIYGNSGAFNQGKDADENKKPIWMSIRDGRLRAAIHYYNTKEEIDEMVDRLPDLGRMN